MTLARVATWLEAASSDAGCSSILLSKTNTTVIVCYTSIALTSCVCCHAPMLAGNLAPGWTANPSLTRLNFTDITLSGSQSLPSEWGTSTNLTWIELNNVRGLAGKLPATWVSGLPALSTLSLSNMPWLSSSLGEYLVLVNQASRRNAAGSTFTALILEGMGLSGSIPSDMFVNNR